MNLVDTHCHLYSDEFEKDIDYILQRAQIEGVNKFFLPAIDSHSFDSMVMLENKYPAECFAMIGLHPCSVKDDYKTELAFIEQWLKKRKFVAIGETGLDFYWDKTFIVQQYEAFRIQIEWSIENNLPIVIHTRNAMKETIGVITEYSYKSIKGIVHCFGGNLLEAEQIIDAGLYLGIGGVVTYKNSGLAEVLKKIDLKHIVVETDAPYLAPVPFRGKRNESSYLKYIIDKISEIKEVTVEEAASITTSNAKKIFGF